MRRDLDLRILEAVKRVLGLRITQVKQTHERVEQAVRRAGFGFIAEDLQRRVQEFVDDPLHTALDGVSVGVA